MQVCVVQRYKLPFVVGRRGEKLRRRVAEWFCSLFVVSHLDRGLKFLALDPALLPWLKLPVT
jgi:hypothetical protein